MSEWPNHSRLSALHIRQACEGSLRRLQTDYIDLYQMHHIDRAAPWEEIWQAMEQLVREGKILYVGSSNFAGWHIARANEATSSRCLRALCSVSLAFCPRPSTPSSTFFKLVRHGSSEAPWKTKPIKSSWFSSSADLP